MAGGRVGGRVLCEQLVNVIVVQAMFKVYASLGVNEEDIRKRVST